MNSSGVELPTTLYHYTTAAGLIGILENKKIWFTDTEYLIDAAELSCYKHPLKEACSMYWSRHGIDRDWSPEMLIDALPENEDYRPDYKHPFSLEHPDRARRHYAFCTSLAHDDITLWSSFTRGGSALGYCIALNADVLSSFLLEKLFLDYSHGPLVYSPDEQRNWYMEQIDAIPGLSSFGSFSSAEKELAFESIQSDIENIAEATKPFLKQEAFRQEREYRFVISLTESENSRGIDLLHYRTSNGGAIVPYLEIDISCICKPLIAEIIMPPTACYTIAESSIRRLLDSQGMNETSISHSAARLRWI